MIAELVGEGTEDAGPHVLDVGVEWLIRTGQQSGRRSAGDRVVEPLEAEGGGFVEIELAPDVVGFDPHPVIVFLIELIAVVIGLRHFNLRIGLETGDKKCREGDRLAAFHGWERKWESGASMGMIGGNFSFR